MVVANHPSPYAASDPPTLSVGDTERRRVDLGVDFDIVTKDWYGPLASGYGFDNYGEGSMALMRYRLARNGCCSCVHRLCRWATW